MEQVEPLTQSHRPFTARQVRLQEGITRAWSQTVPAGSWAPRRPAQPAWANAPAFLGFGLRKPEVRPFCLHGPARKLKEGRSHGGSQAAVRRRFGPSADAREERGPAPPPARPGGASAPSPLEGAGSRPPSSASGSARLRPPWAPASLGPFQSVGLRPPELRRGTRAARPGPALPGANRAALPAAFYALGHREASRRVRGGTAKAGQNQKPRASAPDLHASRVLPRVSSILTVVPYPDGETEAQGSARVYCVWVAQPVRGRQEAKARRPTP